MSILIKGMEMPTRCGRCDMCVPESDGDIDWHNVCCITGADIVDAIEKLSKPRWIPVTERLPEEYVNVLVFLHSLDWNSIYYSIDHLMEDGQWWKASTSWKHEVTHWMPLPEPPKEG